MSDTAICNKVTTSTEGTTIENLNRLIRLTFWQYIFELLKRYQAGLAGVHTQESNFKVFQFLLIQLHRQVEQRDLLQ